MSREQVEKVEALMHKERLTAQEACNRLGINSNDYYLAALKGDDSEQTSFPKSLPLSEEEKTRDEKRQRLLDSLAKARAVKAQRTTPKTPEEKRALRRKYYLRWRARQKRKQNGVTLTTEFEPTPIVLPQSSIQLSIAGQKIEGSPEDLGKFLRAFMGERI